MSRPEASTEARLAALGIARAVPFRVAMATRFRSVLHRDGWLFEGPAGWGEFSPFPEYPPEVTVRWLRAAIEAATVPPPAPVRDSAEVNVTVPAIDPDEARDLVLRAGCRTAKVKVAEPGQDAAQDVARVAAVRDGLGPEGRIRVDANAAWDVPTASVLLERLASAAGGLEYAEQPCRTLDELRDLRGRTAVRIAVDESLRAAPDVATVARAVRGAAYVAVLKVQPLGGVGAALRLADAIDLPAVVSSALETSIGLAVGLELALALPSLAGACGLGTSELLAEDVVDAPLRPVAGRLASRSPLVPTQPAAPADLGPLRFRLDAALSALDV